MDGAKTELKVGITVLVAVAILVVGLLWLKGFELRRNRYLQYVWFPTIGALNVGDPVSVSGVTKGKVESIALSEGGVKVGLYLANDVPLRRDAAFTIKNVGLMGERFIDVRTGSAPEPLSPDSVAHGVYDTGIPEVMGLMGHMTEDVRELVQAIRASIGSDTTLDRLAAVATSLERISAQATTVIERNQTGIDKAVSDFGAAAAGLRRMMESNDKLVDRSVRRIDSTTTRLAAFAERLDSLAVAAHGIVTDLKEGNGTLPRLIHDDQLLRRWETTVNDIDELINDIRANPKKYLKVDVSLF